MEFRRRELLKGLNLGPAAVFPALAMPSGAPAATASPSHIRGIANGTAIQGVCAWPNLQILADGTILAMIFNQPCHGPVGGGPRLLGQRRPGQDLEIPWARR